MVCITDYLTQDDVIKKYRIDELEKCLEMIEDEFANKINGGNYVTSESYFDIVLRCVGKSILTLRELILLCKNGFPDGALGLARNLFEQFIIISRFEMEDENNDRKRLVEKYCADYEIQRCKNMKKMYEYAGMKEEMEKYQDAIDGYKKQFEIKQFGDCWWCGQNSFANLCKFIIDNTDDGCKTLVKNLHISYKRACLALHANSFGNSNRLCGTFSGINLSPTGEGQEYALDLAVKSFIMVAMVAYRELELDSRCANEQLNELSLFYQNMILNKK